MTLKQTGRRAAAGNDPRRGAHSAHAAEALPEGVAPAVLAAPSHKEQSGTGDCGLLGRNSETWDPEAPLCQGFRNS